MCDSTYMTFWKTKGTEINQQLQKVKVGRWGQNYKGAQGTLPRSD